MNHPDKIVIEFIDHADQRYTTCGDWFEKDGILSIRVSKLSDWRRSVLVAFHEFVEVELCRQDGVTQEQVDQFDFAFEDNREEGDESEPGDSPDAPYRKQHLIATGFEKILCAMLGVDWADYDREIMELPEVETKKGPCETPAPE